MLGWSQNEIAFRIWINIETFFVFDLRLGGGGQLSQTPVVQIHLLTLWNGQLFFVLFCFLHHSIETGGSIKTFMHYWPRGQSVGYVTSPQWVGDTSPRSAWSKRHQKITNKLAYDIRCMCLCTCLFIYALKYGLNIYSFVFDGMYSTPRGIYHGDRFHMMITWYRFFTSFTMTPKCTVEFDFIYSGSY